MCKINFLTNLTLILVTAIGLVFNTSASEQKGFNSNLGVTEEFTLDSKANQIDFEKKQAPALNIAKFNDSGVEFDRLLAQAPVPLVPQVPQNFQNIPQTQFAPQPYPNQAPQGQAFPAANVVGQYPAQAPAPPVQTPQVIPPIGSEKSLYAFYSYRLSYMQSDRVLALLKALGYSTVEFSSGRGESINESIFTEFAQPKKYPIVVKILDAAKTSLMQPAMDGARNVVGLDRLSGTYLHQSTTGAPEQRLLFIYEKKDPEQLNALLNLLRNEVDVAASQIVIEALVVEINTNKAKELGLRYKLNGSRTSTNFDELDFNGNVARGIDGSQYKFNTVFNSDENSKFQFQQKQTGVASGVPIYSAGMARINPLGFQATLDAFISDGTAEVLTNPTILVLDGRQALIRIGTQIPNETIQTTNYGTQKSVNYIDTGIVLNIRPRISEDGSEVTMQTETIVSSAIYDASDKDKTPSIESKTVQSFVRVADNTPFIIGGLIDKKKTKGQIGIPFLSSIPVIGNLFKSRSESGADREVIIVLTPHIMDASEKSFSYVIPKDSQSFDSFDNLLFRNAYRIRDDDLFDLSFATKSEFYQNILSELNTYKRTHPEIADDAPVFSYLDNKVPGEEVIVRRMIWEIVHKSKYHQYIADDHILLFEENQKAEFGNKFKTHLLNQLFEKLNGKTDNSLVFNFADHKANSAGPFEHPRAKIYRASVSSAHHYIELMSRLNTNDPERNTILLSNSISPPGVRGANALEVLKGVLVLKRILALNSTMPVTIDEFRVGRQITFPTEQELKDKYHVIDYDVARFFYEVINYYPEFEQAFNRDSAKILYEIKGVGR